MSSEFDNPATIIRYLPFIIIIIFVIILVALVIGVSYGESIPGGAWVAILIVAVIIGLVLLFFYWLCRSGYTITAWFLLIFIIVILSLFRGK